MPLNFNNPTTTQLRTNYAGSLQDHQKALAQWLDDAVAGTLTSTPTGAFRTRSADNGAVQRWNGTSWAAQPINGINYLSGRASVGSAVDTVHTFKVGASNPTRGMMLMVRNDASSAQSGSQIQISQNGIADWAIGQPAGVNEFAIWSGRSTAADGTKLFGMTSSIGSFSVKINSPAFEMNGTGGAPSTGIAAPASSTLAIYCNTVEMARFLPSGRLLIGSASDTDTACLQLLSASNTIWARFRAQTDAFNYMRFSKADTTALGFLGSALALVSAGGPDASTLTLRSEAAMSFATGGGTARVRISAAGELGINCAPVGTLALRIQNAGSDDAGLEVIRATSTEMVVQGYNRATPGYVGVAIAGTQLRFGALGGEHRLLSSGHWQPQGTTETLDLGDATHRYRTLYAKDLNISGDLVHSGGLRTYVPTLTLSSNIASASLPEGFLRYEVLFGRVHVWGVITIDPTSASAPTVLGISIPVASTFTVLMQCNGYGLRKGGGLVGNIGASTTFARATLDYTNDSVTTAGNWAVDFWYDIV